MSDPIVEASGIRKEYFRKGRQSARHFDAVPACDLALHGGTLVVLRGRSGSGKTTLLNMLSGLLEPTEGKVLFDGIDLYGLGDAELSRLRNERIGIVPQGQTALYSLSVIQNVLLQKTMHSAEGADDEAALEVLAQLGIEALADSMPSELSGGEMRRMSIARALFQHPDVIFADEPTGDLDDESTDMVMRLLRQEAERGACVFVVTHEQAAERFADEVLEMPLCR